MSKNAAILTINDNNNYGNRLQNYAIQEVLKKYQLIPKTIINDTVFKEKITYKNVLNKISKKIKQRIKKKKENDNYANRRRMFEQFNVNIDFYIKKININNIPNGFNESFDYFFTGSDQVWNPTFLRMSDIDFLTFADMKKRTSFSASFGINNIPEELKKYYKEKIGGINNISVREESGKKIVEELTGREDVQVLVDPTMLLTAEEWNKVSRKPKQLENDRYILNYFLGELSETRKKEIDRIAKENNCKVINILDKNSPFYQTGPSEFLYLEKNAFLICTDSFHSSVFAILYNRPFIVFDREDSLASMNSRIETLINKFNLKNRKFTGKITEKNLNHDYKEAYEILEKERKKSDDFLRKALDINNEGGDEDKRD